MKDNNSNEPIVLGELKKEKSSKPFFVFIVFALIIGVSFGLPYIKDYMSKNDNLVTNFFNSIFPDENNVPVVNNPTTKKSTTTTTKTSNKEEIPNILLVCKTDNNKYTYTFKEDALITINHEYIANDKSNMSIYITDLSNHRNLSFDINKITNSNSKVVETTDGFIFTAEIDLNYFNSNSLKENKDDNYYELNTNMETVKNEMISKGFEC